MSFSAIALFGAFVLVAVNFLKQLASRQWNAVLTQGIAWGAGLAAVFLFAATTWGHTINVNGASLSSLGVAERVVLGLMLTSVAGVGNNVLAALGLKFPPMFPRVAARTGEVAHHVPPVPPLPAGPPPA